MYGVEPNFLDVAYDTYFLVDEYDTSFSYSRTPTGKYDIIKSLYTEAGKGLFHFFNKFFIVQKFTFYNNQ